MREIKREIEGGGDREKWSEKGGESNEGKRERGQRVLERVKGESLRER